MKTKEELKVLKNEFETLNKKLAELSEKELEMVVGGVDCGLQVIGGGQRQRIVLAQSPSGGLSGSAKGEDTTIVGENVGMVPGLEDISGGELDPLL